ncbi:hypothetical protein PbB2_01289 [Candidatus Phycosocius bacilliformis]|uniref:BioF2-like acetyltransferase domain-containing protein n=1 Tax=Candidatus Phycosocius bacilliformis TaxID=1445552 RepID=A0A2P2E982_9PROT|nr:GNAT family N-acetyltransferase [Candidatus Phycosocius bacilliformis]GBF57621.1 hypothetical protein PbB2_01289 [Candidatus Phycosocius bacilliformis]
MKLGHIDQVMERHLVQHPSHVILVPLMDIQPSDIARMASFRDVAGTQATPFLSPAFLVTAGPVIPGGQLACFMDGDTVVGYFAFQRRGQTLQPAGAPLTDYHAPIMQAGYQPDWDMVLKASGARRLEFNGMIGDHGLRADTIVKHRQIAAVWDGFDSWFAQQKARSPKFFKNLGRCTRNIAKDLPDMAFVWRDVTEDLLDWVLDLKVAQYKRTGMHDVFDCGWTRDLLLELARKASPDFGLKAGVFHCQGDIIAAEICLIEGKELHFWFPAYSPDYARYSPGVVLTFEIIRHLSAQGVEVFDFGSGGEAYKSPMTTDGPLCYEGQIGQALHLPVKSQRLNRMWLSVWRRAQIVRACETSLSGKIKAFASLLHRLQFRVRQKAMARMNLWQDRQKGEALP